MSTMIERVAHAIEVAIKSPEHALDFEQITRAAIEAMLEPTSEMVAAGSWASHGRGEIGSTGARNAWRIMISKALG